MRCQKGKQGNKEKKIQARPGKEKSKGESISGTIPAEKLKKTKRKLSGFYLKGKTPLRTGFSQNHLQKTAKNVSTDGKDGK